MEFDLQRLVIFLSVFTVILFLGYSYAASRLSAPFELNTIQSVLLWSAVVFLVLLTPSAYILSMLFRETPWQKFWAYSAFTTLGFSTILVSFVAFRDLGNLAWKGSLFITDKLQSDPKQTEEGSGFSRRDFISRFSSFALLGMAGGLTAFGMYQAKKTPSIKKVSIKVKDLPDGLHGFKIAQLSDIHIGPTIKGGFLEEVVRKTNSLEADLVAVTGDLVDGTVGMLKDHVSPLKGLKSKHGTFFVTGNHEYYSGVLAWIRELQDMGIHVLLNQNKLLEHNGATLAIAGVTDYKAHTIIPGHRTDPKQASLGAEDAHYKVLLAHQPNSIFEAAKAGFHLQLSGHTHGGQYFPGNVFIHLFQKFVAGLSEWEGTQLYVSRGTGYWGPPIRIGAPSEITILVLEKET
ncbi:metallophosphoesterase [Leptospira langatensis]|uniref:Metallophosphoesterase n=1 Tax=Leptospira langatensis TaxID=2484983 RepID=A0A5F1ZSK2_9LEPT|nr:metallophosphoesterase [Leptospira langatensis]TGJ98850.1 metallophosphoesterase [Leptospira langatensis]TGL40584.1 metallophosphoesterase [Leptospira langatensis]